MEAIALAERLKEVADGLGHKDTLPRAVPLDDIKRSDYADAVRAELGITDSQQTQARDARQFYYLPCCG